MSRCRDQRGQAEIVIIFPVAMLVVLLLLQAALWFLARSIANDAAQDGARAAAIVDGSPSAGRTAAANDLVQLAGSMLTRTSVTADRNGDRAQVTVVGRAESIFPGWSLTVTAVAMQPIEEFRS
jgi:Flp pilus assembly protein TadG